MNDRSDKKDLIIESSILEFSEKGYHKTSMRGIAKRAGIAVGTIYNYFPNKKELYKAVILKQANLVLKAMEEVYQDKTITKELKLKRMLERKCEVLLNYREFIRLHLQEFWENSIIGINFSEFREVYKRKTELIAKLLTENNGKPIEENVLTAEIILRIIAFFLVNSILDNIEFKFDSIWERLKEPIVS
ncbi:MAG: TetR/AcrR family transcriptional regulator [candidate division WOR-3 bacterium]